MLLNNYIYIFLLVFNSCIGFTFGFFEIVPGIASYVYQNFKCSMSICCNEKEIPAQFLDLEYTLEKNLYGQPLVQNTVVKALRGHWREGFKPSKALTLSFHGGPGVGKNYVSKFIQEALYKDGMKSAHVHNFIGRIHFPEAGQVNVYKKNLADWVVGNVTRCPRQLFMFDEVNNMPAGVLDVLKPFMDYVDYIDGVSYREVIFLLLSNTGYHIINELTYNLWKQGINRDDLTLSHFEKIIAQGSFNEKGGFLSSDVIKCNLVDHYIPFLPLMEPHLISCVKKEFEKRGVLEPTKEQILQVMEFIDWGPENDKIFSKTGCKRISQKVALLV